MKCYECSMFILFRKLIPGIKNNIVRRPVTRKCNHRSIYSFASALFCFVAAIFRSKDFFLLKLIVIAIGPSKVGTFFNSHHFFSRQFCSLLFIIHFREHLKQSVATVLGCIQIVHFIVPLKTHGISYTCCVFHAIFVSLV